jgi:hypothetical protein
MAFSVVQICNLALSRVGISRQISSMDERSQESVTCGLFYEPMRDTVLRDFPWPFASTYADLGLVTQNPNDEWLYAYRYPSDCVRALRLPLGDGRGKAGAPFCVSSDTAGLLVFTDQATATLQYTRRVEDPSLFTADFAIALSWRIASEIARPLSVSPNVVASTLQGYQDALIAARAASMNESGPEQNTGDACEFVDVRS